MKKNNGFTLIELLAVVVLLGVLVTIVVTQGTDIFHTTKNKISKINEKNLKDSASSLADSILMCELDDNIYNELNLDQGSRSCSYLKNKLFNDGVEVSVESLKKLDLFEDVSNICNGNMTIKANESDYKLTITFNEDLICK